MSFFKKSSVGTAETAKRPGTELLRRHSSRRGAFSAGITALAVVAVIVFNLIIGQLPQTATQFDMTDSQIYNISQTSEDYLSKMTSDVAIHVLADKKSVDSRIVRFLDKYVSTSDHLSLEYVDPTVYPSVLTKYNCEANTIVVTCADTGRQETVSISDIIGYDEMSYYMYGTNKETSFDAEGRLLSAIDGVLTDSTRKVYETTGHGETALPSSIDSLLDKVHMSVSSVNLLTDGGIPSDCDLLVINDPTKDLADDELSALLKYLAGGGQVIYCMAGQPLKLTNFETLCSDYGLRIADGMIADTQRCYQNNPYLFFPQVDTSVDAASGVDSDATLMMYASRGFSISQPTRSTITVTPFLTTSANSYSVVDENTQTKGTYDVAAVATEKIDDNITARLTVYGSDSLVNQDILSRYTNIANSDLFMSSVTAGFKDISSISVDPVSLEDPTNTISTGGIWAALFIFVLPVGLLIFGFVRWMRRRKL